MNGAYVTVVYRLLSNKTTATHLKFFCEVAKFSEGMFTSNYFYLRVKLNYAIFLNYSRCVHYCNILYFILNQKCVFFYLDQVFL